MRLNIKRILHKSKPSYSVACIIVLAASILMCTFFSLYNSYISNYKTTLRSKVQMLANQDDMSSKTLQNFIVSFSANPSVINILTTPQGYSDSLAQLEVSSLLMQCKSNSGEVNNIFLYNSAYNILYNCGEFTTVSTDFIQSELYDELKKVNNRKNFLPCSKDNFNQAFYVIFSSVNTHINNAIIVQISINNQPQYQNYQDDFGSSLIVTNDYGDIIYSNADNYPFGGNISNYSNLNIDPLSNLQGELKTIKDAGEKQLLSSFRYESLGKNYYIMTPYSNVFSPAKNSSALSIYGFILSLVGIIVLISYLFKSHKQLSLNATPFITSGSFIDTANKDSLYNSLTGISDPMILQSALSQNFSPTSRYILVYIQAEEFDSRLCVQDDKNLYLYGLDNIFSELVSNCAYKAFNIYTGADKLIYAVEGIHSPSYINNVQVLCEKFINASNAYINLLPSIYISDVFFASNHTNAYLQIMEVKKYQFFYNTNVVLFSSKDIHTTSISATQGFECQKEELNGIISENSGSKEDILKKIRSSFEIISSMEYSEAREKILSLFYEFYYTLKTMIAKNLYRIPEIDILEYTKTLNSAKNIYEAQQVFESIVEILYDNISKNDLGKSRNYLVQCIKIIDESYSDPLLTPESIASKIGLSPSYLAKKIKEETPTSLSTLIREKRLVEAASMLSDTNDSITKIVEKCGFVDKSYFTVIFKKHFNCTPTVYRKNAARTQNQNSN